MPRGKKKGGRKAATESHSRPVSDDDVDVGDNWSTASVLSEDHSDSIPEEGYDRDEVDEISSQEDFENKLKEMIDGLSQKSAVGRKSCLTAVIKAFSSKYLIDFLADRKVTVADALSRCLKKGKGDEQALAAQCCSLLCIQLGHEADDVMGDFQPILLSLLADNSATLKTRGECAIAVAMCVFITSSEIEVIGKVMESLANIFKGAFRKGDNSIPSHTSDVYRLHASALTAWNLLLSIAPQFLVNSLLEKYFSSIQDLLYSQDIDLKIVGGETMALFYELGRYEDEEYEEEALLDLCETLKRLSTETHKYQAKRDRRQQKSNFRDILRGVQNGEAPEMTIKFASERLEIYSWVRKMQYNAFCHALGSGVYQHLQANGLVRDVFELGEPILQGRVSSQKPTKWERAMYNAAAFKARTKARAKYRDKRSVTMNGD